MIEFFNVTRKMFRDEEEAIEVSVYDFLYMDKVNDEFHHFVLLEDGAVLDKIQLKDVHMLDGSILSTPSWLFYLESKDDINEILGIVQKKKATTRAENVRGDFFGDQAKDDYIEENIKDKIMEMDGKKDVKLTLNDDEKLKTINDDNLDGIWGEQCVAKSEVTIKVSDIMQYWEAKPHKRRKFVAGMVGADWPKMYGTPCAVVFNINNHVKVVGSQKRADNFAKVTSTCKICSARHNYDIVHNPFKETITKDGLVVYEPVQDMIVDVTVIGRFELDDNSCPIISKPKHDLNKSAGLHLKGRACELFANRATEVGTKSTYLEQLDYADEHQIKFGNKSFIKSILVIKQAILEQERKIAEWQKLL